MATLFARHKVSDYANWRKAYDDFASFQKANGVTANAVYQSTDDPNEVTVTHEFNSVAEAKSFAQHPELKETMQRAGVVGVPDIWFASRV